MRPGELFVLAWIAWIASWLAAAFWYSKPLKRAATYEVWAYRGIILIGAVLLNHRFSQRIGAPRLWYVSLDGAYALVGVAVVGFLFAWWARVYLGPLWSGAVTVKSDHRVVDTGPYALVRHPIYTGLITATLATAAAEATAPALAGLVLIAFGLWIKARLEERFLAAELGPDAYGAYRNRVPMLVPFMPG
jgi:protein-S-isoprenylcysteine O-methyltransferase Ste14